MAVRIAPGAVAHTGRSEGFAIGCRSRHNFLRNIGRRFIPYKAMNLFPGRVLGRCRVQPEPVARSLTHRPCYENTDIVALKCLKPSQGKRKRISQIHQAMADNLGEGFADNDVYNYDSSNTATDRSSSVNNKPKNKKGHRFPRVQLPNLPYPLPQMPDMKSPRNLSCPIGVMDMPIAPPLPFLRDDAEEQALSSMLISWYMSGYYAGLYQGLKRRHDTINPAFSCLKTMLLAIQLAIQSRVIERRTVKSGYPLNRMFKLDTSSIRYIRYKLSTLSSRLYFYFFPLKPTNNLVGFSITPKL
ncbi:hypothetical protein EVAR_48683_1 [Eumeta japonica]|uniref:Uncharacterized protein n=1 Tax=Eumeta variegata TaxID=151549 RepID=A0A4C1XBC5_EUMVA|nr:hypothetical protein EVAR_48683_1 [Eumeta japonica]